MVFLPDGVEKIFPPGGENNLGPGPERWDDVLNRVSDPD